MRFYLFGYGISCHYIKFPILTIDWWEGDTWHEYYLLGWKANPQNGISNKHK